MLGDTFTYQMEMTVVLVSALRHGHVFEISSRDPEILLSHLTATDVQPAPRCCNSEVLTKQLL